MRKQNQPRLRFDLHHLEKFRDPDVACTFRATICGKFTPFISLRDEDMDINTAYNNTAVTDAAREILGNECHKKMPWVTRDVLNLFDERR